MEKAAGGIFGILFIAVIGLGIYAWTQREGLAAAQTLVGNSEARAKAAEASAQDLRRTATSSGNALAGCQTQLTEANKRAEEAAAKPPARRR